MLLNQRNLPSASSHAEGVLGRLMRAFPARSMAEVDEVVASKEQTATAAAPTVAQDANASRGFFARIENWIWRQQQREREAYLADATDIADLEARMRVLEHRKARLHTPF